MTNTKLLAAFAANLKYEQIPIDVVRRTEDLFLDWFGAALAGRGARPVESIQKLALTFGPQSGPCEILISRRSTSPLFAAMVNAAAFERPPPGAGLDTVTATLPAAATSPAEI